MDREQELLNRIESLEDQMQQVHRAAASTSRKMELMSSLISEVNNRAMKNDKILALFLWTFVVELAEEERDETAMAENLARLEADFNLLENS